MPDSPTCPDESVTCSRSRTTICRGGESSIALVDWCREPNASKFDDSLPKVSAVLTGEFALLATVASASVFDLHERQPDVSQRVTHRRGVIAESVAKAFNEARDGINRQCGLCEICRNGAEVNGRKLIEAHHMIGDDHRRRNLRELTLYRLHCLKGAVYLRVRGFIVHVR